MWFGGLSKYEDRNFFLMAFATVDLVNLTLLPFPSAQCSLINQELVPVMGFEFIDV